jgi:hypothetical protein
VYALSLGTWRLGKVVCGGASNNPGAQNDSVGHFRRGLQKNLESSSVPSWEDVWSSYRRGG